jgi:uncharacterized tellurite resistance protein B-like protein
MDPEQYFTNLVLAAMVDGELADEEMALLEKHAENLRLNEQQAQAIVNRVFSGELTQFRKPASPEGRKAAFRSVVRILRADKKITKAEQRMIRLVGRQMEISEEAIKAALGPKWKG